jgi:hypothetical protein
MVSSVPRRRPSARSAQNQSIGRVPGAPTNPPLEIVTITETGSPGGDLRRHAARRATRRRLLHPETGNGLVDGATDLASPRRGFAAGIGTNPAVRKENS